MPKKTANTRSSVQQRRKPKAQKSFELVRPVSAEDEIENNDDNADEPTSVGVATSTVSAPSQKRVKTTTPSIRSEKAAATLPESEKSTAQKTEKTPVLNTVENEEPAEVVRKLYLYRRPNPVHLHASLLDARQHKRPSDQYP